jgi:hypothetical protein
MESSSIFDKEIEAILICNSDGLPFYSKIFGNGILLNDMSLLSGLITAIDVMGSEIFGRHVAIITYRDDAISHNDSNNNGNQIIIISKDIFSHDQHINFVYYTSINCPISIVRQITTHIFMEIKVFLQAEIPNYQKIKEIADKIIEHNYSTQVMQIIPDNYPKIVLPKNVRT